MEIYKLTSRGEMLAHNIRPQVGNDRWRVIYFLSKNGQREKKDIINNTGASSYTLSFLASKGVIVKDQGIEV